MRRGSQVDVIMTSMPINSMLGDDVVEYGRKFAVNARFITLREVTGRVEDIERALVHQSIDDRLTAPAGWN